MNRSLPKSRIAHAFALVLSLALIFCVAPSLAYADEGSTVALSKQDDSTSNTSLTSANTTAPSLSCRAHVQKSSWMGWQNPKGTAGTLGKGLRMEAFQVKLAKGSYSGGIEYRAHVQKQGWTSWVGSGKTAGSMGKGLRMEAIGIRLTGELAENFDIYYRVHSQNFGWLGWAKNGASAGTAGYGYRAEALQMVLVKKGAAAPGSTTNPYRVPCLTYQTHVQRIGWQSWVKQGQAAGTSGKGLRLEALRIKLEHKPYSGGITYRTHVQTYGWQAWKSNGAISGTSGQSKRLEAIQIKLTGKMAEQYDIYYRTHIQNYGWMGWAKNGESSGSASLGYRMEALEIQLVKKGGKAPGSTKNAFTTMPKVRQYLRGIDISSWNQGINLSKIDCDFVIVKVSQGTTYVNPYWKQWAKAALAQGKKLGLYHYASTKNYTAEADFFIKQVKNAGYLGKAVLVYDWEDIQNSAWAANSPIPKKWCDYVKKKTGVTPWIYVSKNRMKYYENSGYPIWVAEYGENSIASFQSKPWNEGAYNCICRQYTSRGKLSGYSGYLDLNKFYGPASLWNQYIKVRR